MTKEIEFAFVGIPAEGAAAFILVLVGGGAAEGRLGCGGRDAATVAAGADAAAAEGDWAAAAAAPVGGTSGIPGKMESTYE